MKRAMTMNFIEAHLYIFRMCGFSCEFELKQSQCLWCLQYIPINFGHRFSSIQIRVFLQGVPEFFQSLLRGNWQKSKKWMRSKSFQKIAFMYVVSLSNFSIFNNYTSRWNKCSWFFFTILYWRVVIPVSVHKLLDWVFQMICIWMCQIDIVWFVIKQTERKKERK